MKQRALSSCIILLAMSANAYAAMIVTDPGSYKALGAVSTSIVGELEKNANVERLDRIKEFTEMANHTTQLVKTVSNLDAAVDSLTGNLVRGFGMDVIMEQLKNNMLSSTMGASVLKHSSIQGLDLKTTKGNAQMLDLIFSNNKFGSSSTEPLRKQYRQRSYKSALETAETHVNNAADRIDQVASIVSLIDVTQTQKDAIDVNNRLMAEMLVEVQKTNLLLAQIVRVNSSTFYHGASNTTIEQTESLVDKAAKSLDRDPNIVQKEYKTPYKKNREHEEFLNRVFGE
ncbi:MAG: hypothetical protein HOM96_02365 [Rickettsiales bacterium]|jgi:hypothetical protein|nr:hypothetical protein [Rickettsiales bacterium]